MLLDGPSCSHVLDIQSGRAVCGARRMRPFFSILLPKKRHADGMQKHSRCTGTPSSAILALTSALPGHEFELQ